MIGVDEHCRTALVCQLISACVAGLERLLRLLNDRRCKRVVFLFLSDDGEPEYSVGTYKGIRGGRKPGSEIWRVSQE